METNNLRKFKLIKEYPGSPKLATELTPKVDKENTDTNNFYWEGSWFNPNDFSEFWEEVLQKDYEILRTCPIVGTIYSVKRLSDGEVFTVGDIIKVRSHGSNKRIDEIEIIENEPSYSDGIWFQYALGCSHLKNAIKVKQPIFLTHDGKDIFEGDTVWWVRKDSTSAIGRLVIPPGEKFNSDMTAYFLTREEAEGYIKRNKVLFTTADGVGIKHGDTYYFVNTTDFYIGSSKANFQAVGMSISFKYFLTKEEAEDYVYRTKVLFTTEDGVGIKKGDIIHTVHSSLDAIDRIMVANFHPEDYLTFKAFSTSKAAEDYIIENKYALSIKEFWEITCMSTSNFNKNTYMKDLVKQKLGL
jgi:hypothetical protein